MPAEDYGPNVVVDCSTGEESWIELTPQEVIARDARAAESALRIAEMEAQEAVRESGEQDFAALPGWATWTVAEAEDYIEAYVTDLASAKAVLKALAKAIVAIRNHEWPGLQDS